MRLLSIGAALAVLFAAPAVAAQATDLDVYDRPARLATNAAEPAKQPLAVELHGYVQPQFGARYYPDALVADRWQYGGLSSRAGLIISGSPIRDWSYVVHLSVDARALQILTSADLIDTDGNGQAEGLIVTHTSVPATLFEEVTIAYSPFPFLKVKMGAMRVPFTVALRSANTAQMFANRPGANEIFQSGSDQGLLALGNWLDGRAQASLGMFTGTSLGLLPPSTDSRGLLYSARVDGNPLGPLPYSGFDFDRAAFRFGVGVGALYRDATLFTRTGYELADIRDVRTSASIRAAFRGGSLQAEAFRRLGTDNVSSRPNRATGAYAQGSFFFPVAQTVGLAPVGRVGVSTEDELTLPRRTVYIEGGVAFFPKIDIPRPDTVRVLAQYLGENRILENEKGHAGILQVQVLF